MPMSLEVKSAVNAHRNCWMTGRSQEMYRHSHLSFNQRMNQEHMLVNLPTPSSSQYTTQIKSHKLVRDREFKGRPWIFHTTHLPDCGKTANTGVSIQIKQPSKGTISMPVRNYNSRNYYTRFQPFQNEGTSKRKVEGEEELCVYLFLCAVRTPSKGEFSTSLCRTAYRSLMRRQRRKLEKKPMVAGVVGEKKCTKKKRAPVRRLNASSCCVYLQRERSMKTK
jgi:hypothetical protein